MARVPRRLYIAGSASKSSVPESLEYAHQLVEQLRVVEGSRVTHIRYGLVG
jgi:hypothetical protein